MLPHVSGVLLAGNPQADNETAPPVSRERCSYLAAETYLRLLRGCQTTSAVLRWGGDSSGR
ncbi:hypothetical protein BJY24_002987 [Nocardia transvalensis]|uniref:Uncharacterized protein n=1 Tax=Nocardia transvalensis TaxID=37333 RepID=A0A7W9PDM7_9NOCA|nr:hypothetical protein [Nocardia transvalensis]